MEGGEYIYVIKKGQGREYGLCCVWWEWDDGTREN